MKKLLTLALLVTLYSCDKKGPEIGTPAGNTNPGYTGGKLPRWDIPNWRNVDTLVSDIMTNGQLTGYDTFYTSSEGYTAVIIHQGKKYYIWKQGTYKEEELLPDQTSYDNCIISPTLKVEDAINKGIDCTVSPNRYIDEKGLWVNQKQVIKFSSNVSEFKGTNYVKI